MVVLRFYREDTSSSEHIYFIVSKTKCGGTSGRRKTLLEGAVPLFQVDKR